MFGWLIALGVLVLIGILPIGISAVYNAEGPLVRVLLGPIRWTVYPAKKKTKPKKERKKKTKSADKSALRKEPSETGGSWKDFVPLVKAVLAFFGELRKKLRVKRLEMKLTLAGGDPCDLALNYGRAWAAVGNLMPLLEKLFIIKKRNVEVQCDFEADSTVVYARLDVTIPLFRLLVLLVRYGIPALMQYIQLRNNRKGGANT